jgi:hypothetical protein
MRTIHRTIHLTSVAKSCYVVSLGIGHHTHMASTIEKDEVCTQIGPFICYHQFQNNFGMGYNKEV